VARGDRLYSGLVVALAGTVITDAFLMYSLYLRAGQVLEITASDQVQQVMLQSYSALVQSQMFLLFSAAVIAVGVIGVLAKLRSWERGAEEEE
jgi:cell division protein FtsX